MNGKEKNIVRRLVIVSVMCQDPRSFQITLIRDKIVGLAPKNPDILLPISSNPKMIYSLCATYLESSV